MKMIKSVLLTGSLLSASGASLATPDETCYGQRIDKTFASGASWGFCWTSRKQEGLTLSQVYYKAPGQEEQRVLGFAALSQLDSSFDDSSDDIMHVSTQLGLGGNNILPQKNSDCHQGDIHYENGTPTLCSQTLAAGYLYKYNNQRQTELFQISMLSQVGPRSYKTRWRFYENGIIEPAVGFSGTLPAIDQSASQYGWPAAANGKISTSFIDHYLWKLDFDLTDNPSDDSIEEISSVPFSNRLKKYKTVSMLQTEIGKDLNPNNKTFWRVLDTSHDSEAIGGRSYELVPSHYDQSKNDSGGKNWLNHDFFFTQYQSCEQYASDNPANNCGNNLADFIDDSQNLVQQDIVVWYRQSNHFLPRAEDSNRIGTRWSSFKLVPRDWLAQNPY